MGQKFLMISHVSCGQLIDHALFFANVFTFSLQPDDQRKKFLFFLFKS